MTDVQMVVGVPAGPDRGELVDRLLRYNHEVTGLEDEELSAFLRDDAGELFAGVYGWMFGGTGEIALLWVREDHRGQGLGASLLASFEAKAHAMGCHQMVMRTHSFQAPDFYRAHGYVDVAAVDNYPSGYRYHLLRKPLGGR